METPKLLSEDSVPVLSVAEDLGYTDLKAHFAEDTTLSCLQHHEFHATMQHGKDRILTCRYRKTNPTLKDAFMVGLMCGQDLYGEILRKFMYDQSVKNKEK